MSAFAAAAAAYDQVGAAVIPCDSDDKLPLVRWARMGRRATSSSRAKWSSQFPDAAIGIICGPSRLTIIDVDTSDESVVRDCLSRFGATPLRARTPRKGWHLYYRSRGETNTVRLDGAPIDVRGKGGFLVAPPSERPGVGAYTFECGAIDDLSNLPHIRDGALPLVGTNRPTMGIGDNFEPLNSLGVGERNSTLWRQLMADAPQCESLEHLIARAQVHNEATCNPPLPENEVVRTAKSAWRCEQEGHNWIGHKGAQKVYFDGEELDRFIDCPEAGVLLGQLRKEHLGLNPVFAISPKGMTSKGKFESWDKRRIERARDFLLEMGRIVIIHQGGSKKGDVSQFAFRDGPRGQK